MFIENDGMIIRVDEKALKYAVIYADKKKKHISNGKIVDEYVDILCDMKVDDNLETIKIDTVYFNISPSCDELIALHNKVETLVKEYQTQLKKQFNAISMKEFLKRG